LHVVKQSFVTALPDIINHFIELKNFGLAISDRYNRDGFKNIGDNNEILKEEWGFDGLVMSDWSSTYSAAGAANGGLDLEMPTAVWMNKEQLLPAVRNGEVAETVIDDKVRRLLRLAVCFGWLDRDQKDDSIPMDDPASRAVALNVARAGTVLLRNENNFLPFDMSSIKRIAVFGPCADAPWAVNSKVPI